MSKKYYFLRRQSGEGCDYTIDCGVSVATVYAKSTEDAVQKIIDVPEEWKEYIKNHEDDLDGWVHDFISDTGLRHLDKEYHKFKECSLLVIDEEIDLFPILEAKLKEIKEFKNTLASKAHDEEELKEYERLKKKFGKD